MIREFDKNCKLGGSSYARKISIYDIFKFPRPFKNRVYRCRRPHNEPTTSYLVGRPMRARLAFTTFAIFGDSSKSVFIDVGGHTMSPRDPTWWVVLCAQD